MKLGYIQTFAELAQSRNKIVTEQELIAFQKRYYLIGTEMDEIKEYCTEHGITIVYTEDSKPKTVSRRIQSAGTYLPRPERRRIISTIASEIVHKGVVRARKRSNGRGWLCGTYTSGMRKTVERYMDRRFTDDQIEFIISHLSEDADDETEFALQDPENQELCDELSRELNALIPKIHLNRFVSDFLDD